MGNVLQSFFFSPKSPTADGIIWGAGPAVQLRTQTNDLLGNEKWGLGPTAVVLKQEGPWTVGILANHIWSVAGNDKRPNVSATYLQPFLAYVTTTHTTFVLNSESTYDWKTSKWSVPVNLQVNQLLKVGGQIISIGAGPRYWAANPETGAKGWGFRATLTFLFPK